jgi:hypothetical protein
MHSGMIARMYAFFDLGCFAFGTGLIFVNGVLRELGIAIVVGSIFAFGSLVAQWWTVQTQREIDIRDHMLGGTERFEELAEMRRSVIRRLDEQTRLDQQQNP